LTPGRSLFTGDWIPDHELARCGDVTLDPGTRGPAVDTALRTCQSGVFAAGDLLHPGGGTTEGAPFYEPLYRTLESAGYRRNRDIRIAGYDARLSPDIGDFLQRAQKLIEDTYHDNGNRPVHLIGHSNGPLYAYYLLTHTTRTWRAQYIHGFTSLAGNFPGQGLLYPVLFTGLNVEDFGYPSTEDNAASSARLDQSAPSTYLSAADPSIFGNRETILEDASTGRTYTPRDYHQLITDAKLDRTKDIADYYLGFDKTTDPTR